MSLADLERAHPKPDVSGIPSYRFTMDGGGRHLVANLIRELDAQIVLEIGVWLGGSCLDWFEASDTVKVIGVDGYPDAAAASASRAA